MPRLPSPDGPRATPRATGGVVDYGSRRESVSGVANAVAGYAADLQQREDAFSYAAAKSKFLVDQSNFMREIESDDDYGTYEERYEQSAKKSLESIAETLRPLDREVFGMEMEVQRQRGLEQMRDLALGKKRDKQRGDLNTGLYSIRQMAADPLTPPAVLEQLPSTVVELLDAAAADGTVSQEERSKYLLQERAAHVEGRVLTFLKSGRIAEAQELLSTDAARIALQPDRIAELKSVSEEQNTLQVATDAADRILESAGNDWNAAYREAGTIKDAKVRQQALANIDARMRRQEMADAEQQEQDALFFATAIIDASDQGLDVVDTLRNNRIAHPERWANLRPENRAQIENLTRQDADALSNAAYTGFMNELQSKGAAEARKFLLNNAASFPPALYRSLTARLNESPQSILTDTQRLSAYIKQNNLGDKEASALGLEYERRLLEETVDGKRPTPDRQNAILENLIVENAGARWVPGDSKRTIEMTPDEASRQFVLADEIRGGFVAQGKKPTLDEISDRISAAEPALKKIRSILDSAGKKYTEKQVIDTWVREGMPDSKDIK